jgi:spore maturation protein SpmB
MNPLEIFIDGLRKGAKIAVLYMLPTVIAAFALIEVLEISGILVLVGKYLSPLTTIFGLPGEAATVLLTALASSAGALGLVLGFVMRGTFTVEHVAIILPAVMLIGSQLQLLGRILAVAGIKSRYIPVAMAIGFMNAALAMLLMRFVIL